ncbi:MAG TPA: hypothetical protein VF669_18535 [Tepidisphaeraceae bacterium]|jgi:hypothetical protein
MSKVMVATLLALGLATGCASMNNPQPIADPIPNHPVVKVSGIDGTVFSGELLNGSVTVDSGQGPLTLLTDHINSIDFAPEADTVNSVSVKVSGKIKEPLFQIRSEHGVFTLVKERLKRIDFVKTPASRDMTSPTMASTTVSSGSAKPRQTMIIP